MMRAALLMMTALTVAGCHGARPISPYDGMTTRIRDSDLARLLTLKAADCMSNDPQKAESLLREALAADLYHGPAHNHLGVLHLETGALYDAAHEFEWAARLMPGHPDPRMNLALTLERAGRVEEAIASYRTALEVYPGHVPTSQPLARIQIRHGLADAQTDDLLESISLAGENAEWREWAKGWRSRRVD